MVQYLHFRILEFPLKRCLLSSVYRPFNHRFQVLACVIHSQSALFGWSGHCAGDFINYGVQGGCECANDNCLGRTVDLQFSVYFVSQMQAPLAYSLVQDGQICTNRDSLTGLWARGSKQACTLLVAGKGKDQGLCDGNHFYYRSAGGECGCATDHCADRSPSGGWSIYEIGVASQPTPSPTSDFSLVKDGAHCSVYNNLRVVGLWTMGGSLESCGQLATGPALSQGLCSGGFFQYAAGNGDCGCAMDTSCNGRTVLSNWAIYYQHPPADYLLTGSSALEYELESFKKHCSNYNNLRGLGLFPMGGTFEQCGLVAISRAGNECNGLFFQYRSSNGDCGCSTDGCEAKTNEEAWDIWKVKNAKIPAMGQQASGQRDWRVPIVEFLLLLWL